MLVAAQDNLLLVTIPFYLAMQGAFITWIVREHLRDRGRRSHRA